MIGVTRKVLASALVVVGVTAATGPSSAQTLTVSHVAGSPGGYGSEDGTGTAARFFKPAGIARDAAGNLFVADTDNHAIRRIAPDGGVATLAGVAGLKGSFDGIGAAARFNRPRALAVDATGRVFVVDTGNHTVRRIDTDGRVTTLAGSAGASGAVDGQGAVARFAEPSGIAIAADGTLLVADAKNHAIRRVTQEGVVSTLAGQLGRSGSADGTGGAARFYYPSGLAVDGSGVVWVADTRNCTIRRMTAGGVVSTFAGTPGAIGASDGTGADARFFFPGAVAVSSTALWVADTSNSTIRRVSAGGEVTTFAGQAGLAGNLDGTGSAARFWYPAGLVSAPDGSAVWVVDTWNHTVRRITGAGAVTTFAGLAGGAGWTDGTGTSARFDHPHGLRTASDSAFWVSDAVGHTIRQVTAAGVVTTVAGLGGTPGWADGTGTAARFASPVGLASAPGGAVVVADSDNHVVRRVAADGTVTTLAGTPGMRGGIDGPAATARFNYPLGVAVAADGSVLVADGSNHAIRRIGTDGQVTTVAGVALQSGDADGVGVAARFRSPHGLAFDSAGNLYIADTGNHTLRCMAPGGQVTTVAGLAGQAGGADGTANAARFFEPTDVAIDAGGRIWVSDTGNHTLRLVTPEGQVTTVAGLAGVPGSTDASGPAARFEEPVGVVVTADGVVWVADRGNNAIRRGEAALADVAVVDSPVAAPGVQRQLDTAPQTATSWQWSIVRRPATSTAALSSATIRNPTFTPDRSELFLFRLEAASATGRSVSTVSISAGATATLSGSTMICRDASATLHVALTGTAPWRLSWSDGLVQDGITESPAARDVSPAATTVYTLATVADATGSGSVGGSATVTVVDPPAPTMSLPEFVTPNTAGNQASVSDAGPGATYVWTLTNGTVTAGAGTPSITFTAGASGEVGIKVVVTNAQGCSTECDKKVPIRYRQYWIPVAAHQPGAAGSQWRTDLGLLNLGPSSGVVHLRLHASTLLGQSTTIAKGEQKILVDVVDTVFAFVGAGPLEILTDQPLVVTSRTYNQSAAGTFGQSYDGFRRDQGVAAGGTVFLPQLSENASYRSNILIANTGSTGARVRLELFDGAGTKVGEPVVNGGAPIASGQRVQLNAPFRAAGQSNLAAGYAQLAVLEGDGVIAYASVVDNNTASNDPTSVLMKEEVFGAEPFWLPVVAHQAGTGGTSWRTDLGLLNIHSVKALVTLRFFGKTTLESRVEVPPHNQLILADIVRELTQQDDAGALQVVPDVSVIVTSRTYNQSQTRGTFGQDYDAFTVEAGLGAGESAFIPQLVQNGSYRSNILVANTGTVDARVKVELFAGSGAKVGQYVVENGTLKPGQRSQANQPFKTVAGRNDLAAAYAKVTVEVGEGILASGSVVDNLSTDPTTLPMRR